MPSEPHLQAVSGGAWVGETHDAPTPPPTDTPPPGGSARDRAAQKSRPDRALPTDRMKFEKQVDALRVFAVLSGSTHGAVTAEDLGKALDLAPTTAGLCSGFFRDSGWLSRVSRGAYSATSPLLEFHRHLNVDPDDHSTAVAFLRETARDSWYWEAVRHLLDGGARMPLVLLQLSKVANANDHKAQLVMLIDWLEWLGLVRREGDVIFPVEVSAQSPVVEDQDLDATDQTDEVPSDLGVASMSRAGAVTRGDADAPAVSEDDAVDALVSFHMSVRITADDAAKLSPEQLNTLLEVVDRLRR